MSDDNDDLLEGDLGDFDYDIADEDALLADDYDMTVDSGNQSIEYAAAKPSNRLYREREEPLEDVLELGVTEDLDFDTSDANSSRLSRQSLSTKLQVNITQVVPNAVNPHEEEEEQEDPNEMAQGDQSLAEVDEDVETHPAKLESEDDEDNEEESSRDRFKSERTNMLSLKGSKTYGNIPDTLDGVISTDSAGLERPHGRDGGWRGKRGRGVPRGGARGAPRPVFHQLQAMQVGNFNKKGSTFNQQFSRGPRFPSGAIRGPGPNGLISSHPLTQAVDMQQQRQAIQQQLQQQQQQQQPPPPHKILINPHFRGAVQPHPEARLIWDTDRPNQQPAEQAQLPQVYRMNTFSNTPPPQQELVAPYQQQESVSMEQHPTYEIPQQQDQNYYRQPSAFLNQQEIHQLMPQPINPWQENMSPHQQQQQLYQSAAESYPHPNAGMPSLEQFPHQPDMYGMHRPMHHGHQVLKMEPFHEQHLFQPHHDPMLGLRGSSPIQQHPQGMFGAPNMNVGMRFRHASHGQFHQQQNFEPRFPGHMGGVRAGPRHRRPPLSPRRPPEQPQFRPPPKRPSFEVQGPDVVPQLSFEASHLKRKKRMPDMSNLHEVQTVDTLPDTTVSEASQPEEQEDEETREYRKKIEEQKRLREKILQQKEERRKIAAMERQKQIQSGSGMDQSQQGEVVLAMKEPPQAIATIVNRNTVEPQPSVQAAVRKPMQHPPASVLQPVQRATAPEPRGGPAPRGRGRGNRRVLQGGVKRSQPPPVPVQEGGNQVRQVQTNVPIPRPGQRIVQTKPVQPNQQRLVLTQPVAAQKVPPNAAAPAGIDRGARQQVAMRGAAHSGRTVTLRPTTKAGAPLVQMESKPAVARTVTPIQRGGGAISGLKVTTSSDKDAELPFTKVVSIDNLSATTSEQQLRKMCRGIGTLENIQMVPGHRRAVLVFVNPSSAAAFCKRYQRKIIDLSMVNVTLLAQ